LAKITTIMETIKPVLASIISESPSRNNLFKRNLLKEYLQVVVLDFIYSHPTYSQLLFYGGSALSDPIGGITVSAPRFEAVQLLGTVDTSHIARQRYQLPIRREEDLEIVRHALETRRNS